MTEEQNPVNAWIVDDDHIYVFGFKKLVNLTGLNTQISHFINGQQAINTLKTANGNHKLPDVIFLDINMPVMDGWEFLQELAEIKPQLGKNIAVYMISSSISLDDIHRAKNIPEISDYIFKPIKTRLLSEIFIATQQLLKHGA